MGGSGSRTLLRVVACSFVAAVLAAACGGGSDSSSDGGSSSTSNTRSEPVDSTFDDAPPLVVSASPSLADGSPPALPLPVGYLERPTAPKATVTAAPSGVESLASPNGEHAAIVREPDGDAPGAVEIFDVTTGRTTEEVEYGGPELAGPVVWAPDGSGLVFRDEDTWYLHQVGGATVEYERTTQLVRSVGLGTFTSNADSVAIISCNINGELTRISSPDPDGEPESFPGDGLCGVAQLISGDGTPVTLASVGPDLFVVDPTGAPRPVYSTGAPAGTALTFTPCDGLAVVSSDEPIGSNETPYFVFELSSGRTVPLPAGISFGSKIPCPIPSPDRTKVAVAQEDGPILVIDLATGASVEVHPSGSPISWSASSDEILVDGDGLFIVHADGSRDVKLLFELEPSGSAGAYCRAGDSGFAVLRIRYPSAVQGERGRVGVLIYEVDVEGSIETRATEIATTCSTTLDDRWVVTGDLVADLEEHRASILPPVNTETGTRGDGSAAIVDHVWFGPQQTLVSAGLGRSSN